MREADDRIRFYGIRIYLLYLRAARFRPLIYSPHGVYDHPIYTNFGQNVAGFGEET